MRAHTDPRTRATPARSRNQAIRSGVGVRLRFLPPAARARARPHSYLHGFHKQGWGFARGNQNPANPTRRPRTNSFLAMQYTCIPAFRTDHHFFSVNLLVQNFENDPRAFFFLETGWARVEPWRKRGDGARDDIVLSRPPSSLASLRDACGFRIKAENFVRWEEIEDQKQH